MPDWNAIQTFAQTTTTTVGEQLLKDFGHVQGVEKDDGSLVTRSDQWADETLRQAIAQAFPEHGVLSEETTHVFPDTEWCWVIDPVDGTTNYTRGIPLWAISLGLLYKGTPVFGHIYVPPIRAHFYGYWYGNSGLTGPTGAFCNGEPIHASTAEPSGNQLFNLCARSTTVMQKPFPCKIRMLGVASYNLLTVAAGAALGGVEATPKIWDIAAVWAIAQAAGATWHALNNDPIFPLVPGEDYGRKPYPTLVVNQEKQVDTFVPLVQEIVR
ncbi:MULTISPECIES: inositol monophosphatase family protein [unclassified Leptolyngbya]|uniref:inositol monophosphatase family protein n=1 Tax=unclassified Leptolyngbya TaxID=2650499 RepID=UPI001688AC04|nr:MULTISPECIES: inositol monophosphatase family protein [unclassified Leptolyngbya]MBD1912931.1 inositol monophosphatase [Leptolyngbya sp. FACHB-8]MBD2154740.1 inositol monophosphatase [Leptolyngbya sp. FACHB-16]